MELRFALLIFGLVVLAIVCAFSVWKLGIYPKRNKDPVFHRRRHSSLEPILPGAASTEQATEEAVEEMVSVAPPIVHREKPRATTPEDIHDTDTAEQALRAAERVANMPVAADPDLAAVSGGSGNRRQIDFVARLPGENVITRDQALGVYRENEYLLEKRHRIFGLSYPARNWCNLEKEPDFGRYSDIGLAVQLADQSGPITESELTRFSLLVLRLSETLGRQFKFSMTFDDAQRLAAELDEFCKSYDVLGILNVVSNLSKGFSGKDIDRYAKEFGMDFGPMNIYHKKNNKRRGGRELYSLANLYKPGEFDPAQMNSFSTQGVTLFMSMPCNREPGEVFADMTATAKHLCERVNGRLVDQDKQSLSPRGLQRTQEELEKLANEMEREGVSPGSEAALRLF
ncbi:MAG: cell division protein ZipA C-terminal FtsZ-binding domain-containing protein [Gammaproteobacteria bacterium]|nr:cell division protein ZipA C-terminal FtsZ-binding domain-containing protein [Gammaproteobacteria bacterium]